MSSSWADAKLMTTPKFWNYDEFLGQSIPPQCRGCSHATVFVMNHSLQVLRAAAGLQDDATEIVSINPSTEETALLAAQGEITQEFKGCNGLRVVDAGRDPVSRGVASLIYALQAAMPEVNFGLPPEGLAIQKSCGLTPDT